MLPSSSDLHYFIEVAQSLNLSRAAERLGLSQPSLSLSIQRLERDVGAQLLIRSKKGVTLTPAGKVFQRHARELVQQWEKVRDKTVASETQVRGSLKLGCHPSVACYSLPGFLPQLLSEHVDLEFHLAHDLSRKITERVISLEVDIGIVVNPVRHPDLVIQKLSEDEVTYWMAEKAGVLTHLGSDHKVLICDPELLQTQALMKSKKQEFREFRRVITSSNLEVVMSLTAAGTGIGILPGRVAALDGRLKKVAGAPVFKDQICLIYRVENRGNLVIKEVAKAVEKVFRE